MVHGPKLAAERSMRRDVRTSAGGMRRVIGRKASKVSALVVPIVRIRRSAGKDPAVPSAAVVATKIGRHECGDRPTSDGARNLIPTHRSQSSRRSRPNSRRTRRSGTKHWTATDSASTGGSGTRVSCGRGPPQRASPSLATCASTVFGFTPPAARFGRGMLSRWPSTMEYACCGCWLLAIGGDHRRPRARSTRKLSARAVTLPETSLGCSSDAGHNGLEARSASTADGRRPLPEVNAWLARANAMRYPPDPRALRGWSRP
jgi:hypothetical protein